MSTSVLLSWYHHTVTIQQTQWQTSKLIICIQLCQKPNISYSCVLLDTIFCVFLLVTILCNLMGTGGSWKTAHLQEQLWKAQIWSDHLKVTPQQSVKADYWTTGCRANPGKGFWKVDTGLCYAPWHCKYVFWPFVFPSGFFQSLSQSAHVKLLQYKLLATVSWLLGYPQNYPSCRSCMQICTDLKQWYALNYSKYHHHLATGNVNFNNPISISFYLFKECGHHRWTNISHCPRKSDELLPWTASVLEWVHPLYCLERVPGFWPAKVKDWQYISKSWWSTVWRLDFRWKCSHTLKAAFSFLAGKSWFERCCVLKQINVPQIMLITV